METNVLHTHQFEETIIPPTCKENGYTLNTCQCGYTHKSNFKPMVSHDFQVTETKEPTCLEPGATISVCSGCGETRSQSVSPLGHDLGGGTVKVYPTCSTPGVRACQCRRCDAVVEQVIPPMKHRCADGTGRFYKGKLVEFFCENCGQTVFCGPKKLHPDYEPKNYWFTEFVLALSGIMALVTLLAMTLYAKNGNVTFMAPWVTLGEFVAKAALGILLFGMARNIRRAERYSRWLGLVALLYAGFDGFWLVTYTLSGWGAIAGQAVTVVLQFGLCLIFFYGSKKKIWPFVVVLCWTLLYSAAVLWMMNDYVALAQELHLGENKWWLGYNLAEYFLEICTWWTWVVLLIPKRKKPELITVGKAM